MNNGILKHIIFFIFCFLSVSATADDIKSIGVPYIQNYPKSVYLSGNQNWSIAKGKNGVMYFGNTQGLLTYDGKYWQQYEMPNRQIVRSVATGDNDIIYTGSFGEFGYWKVDNKRLKYTSLINLIPKEYKMNDEIWKIYVDGKRIIFQSFSSLYIYNDNKISVVKIPAFFLFLHKVDKRFILEALGKGLYELEGNNLIPLKNTGAPLPGSVLSILPYKNGSLLIGTSKDGLFLYDGEKYTPFNTPANAFLQTYQLNNGAKVLGKYYAYGTILNGLIIIDENGNIVQRINKSSGLQNNTVLSLYADDEQNLWTGLDNGIDRIELNSPLYFYFDKTGLFGTVYSSLIYKDNIYLGTNQGLFYSPWVGNKGNSFSSFDFKLIPKSQGQVWDLQMIDGQLLCGHNDGTFSVNGNTIEKVTGISGGWVIKKLNDNYLIQGTYNGLVLFKKDPTGQWKFDSKIKGFDEPSRYLEQDAKGDIWVSHAYRGLYKLVLSADFKTVTSTKYYDERNGLPSTYGINLFTLDNKLIYSSSEGFLTYDEISNKFSKYTTLNKELGSFATSHKIIKADYKKYWFINHGKMALVNFSQPGKIEIDSNRFSVLDGRMVQYYENISKISDHIYLISVDDGFVIYNELDSLNHKKIVLPSVLIRKVEDITDTYSILSEVGNTDSEIEIPFSRNNIRISYALPYYRQSSIKFQYFLKGYSKQWADWSTASQKDFTNLSAGTYTFLVRAKINDETISKDTEFEFTILPPFYASKWAFALYLIGIVLLLIAGKRFYERKLKKDQQAISDKLQTEKEEFLKKEAEATERQIIKLQTEKLQVELAGKNRELANSAMSLVYKNELLQKLSQEMLKLKDSNGKPLAEEQLRKIQKVIDDGMNDERDWNLFESSFNEAHESFFKKLKANHPDLVPNDLKLCAYLHMNMSSKEMASLLNISLRGVEIRRYRLRKKLDVPHDKNLVEFLMEL
ncbi:triple tyrosine motif-containing protein [Pedobacter foliorum]|uniref:ligand-binding sensor domain-containing protein n=1 Tax=Pedobacter foliorum TaxID=2739058 RepID=UPI0015678DAE|nr:triple tyrosine motif-containing protein [Pedobacter foliorum]NRF41597.1 transcriptional regulator [Pedobacter foliorum]